MARLIMSIIFIYLISISIGLEEEDSGFESSSSSSLISDLLDSFTKFTCSLQTLFLVPIEKLEMKSQQLKRAIKQFLKKLESEAGAVKELTEPLRSTSTTTSYVNKKITVPSIISQYDYESQIHFVYTIDGYILTIHRVVPKVGVPANNKIVLLHHGLLGSSYDWLLLGKKSLPFLLLEVGYDVWLANARGNRHSRSHLSKDPESADYWNFSFHEIGLYDLSAVLNYIRTITQGSVLIDFIGHSMGGTALLTLLSSSPQYNLILRSAVLLGPMGFMYNAKGPLQFLAKFYKKHGDSSLDFLGENEFLPSGRFPEQITKNLCTGDQELCQNPWLFLANGGKLIPSPEIRKRVLELVPSGASVKTIKHYLQLISSGQFRMFDFGTMNNTRNYGMASPPAFRLNDVTIPIAFITAKNDWLSTKADIQTLVPNLATPIVHHIIGKEDFSHTDYVWSKKAPQIVYFVVLDILDRIKPRRGVMFG